MSEKQSPDEQIVRMWSGTIRAEDRDAYVAYVEQTGMREYRQTAGNLDAWVLTRDLGDGLVQIATLSRWASMEAVRRFAGDEPERAVFYPEDDRYLVERDERVVHFHMAAD